MNRKNLSGIANIFLNVGIIFLVIFLMFFVGIKAYNFAFNISNSGLEKKNEVTYTLVLDKKTKYGDVLKILEKKGIISNEFLFSLNTIIFDNNIKTIEAGTYFLSSKMDFRQLNQKLYYDKFKKEEVVVTIREGLTIKEVGQVLQSKGLGSAEEFIKVADTTEYDHSFLEGLAVEKNYLEGFLFPDTYSFYKDSTPSMIISRMLDRFDTVYTDEMRVIAKNKNLTTKEVITIASIIEKEIRAPYERELASSVIYNRLEQNMDLQMCSTVLYVLDIRKEVLSLKDLEIESDYNTYRNKGLPPGPISSPGEASIIAALNPKKTDYIYFVVSDELNGTHYFTSNYNDFLNAKAKYEQEF